MAVSSKPIPKDQLEREARLKVVALTEYMNHPYCPPHTKKELEERIKKLRVLAYGTK